MCYCKDFGFNSEFGSYWGFWAPVTWFNFHFKITQAAKQRLDMGRREGKEEQEDQLEVSFNNLGHRWLWFEIEWYNGGYENVRF